MDLPNFPNIEVAINDDETLENPILENFLQQFIAQQMHEITQTKSSCENLKKSNESLQALKDKYHREIFTLTHSNISSGVLSQQFPQRMQGELGMFRMSGQRVNEMLVNFHKDYLESRRTLEQKMQSLLGTDELFDLSQHELELKLESLKKAAKKAEVELQDFEETTEANQKLLKEELKTLNEEIKTLQSVKSDMDATQQQFFDEIREIKIKDQQDTNKLLKEIADLKKKLELYD